MRSGLRSHTEPMAGLWLVALVAGFIGFGSTESAFGSSGTLSGEELKLFLDLRDRCLKASSANACVEAGRIIWRTSTNEDHRFRAQALFARGCRLGNKPGCTLKDVDLDIASIDSIQHREKHDLRVAGWETSERVRGSSPEPRKPASKRERENKR